VTRKITFNAAKIKLGLAKELRLGNLDAQRDWGHSQDFVPAMWMMLQQDTPDDYVVATGITHSVREFCAAAFGHVGLNHEDFVVVDTQFFRPAEVDVLKGESGKARRVLGWAPRRRFEDIVSEMVETDLEQLKK
jgi:GDPmannose 4,6-dehydratase